MIVYRVEHGEAIDPNTGQHFGPCADQDRLSMSCKQGRSKIRKAQDRLFDVFNGRYGKVTPWGDPLLRYIDGDEFCGTASMADLRFWFEDSLEALGEAGFVISAYRVPDQDCRVGDSGQVLFKFNNATLISREDAK